MLFELGLLLLIWVCILFRDKRVPFIMLIVVMFVLMAFSYENADYIAYSRRYAQFGPISDVFSTDIGFGFVMYICKALGLSYTGFLCVIAAIGLAIVFYALNSYSDIPNVVLVAYFMLFYYIHTVQLRAFISEWIIVCAVLYYLQKESKLWKYVCLIIIALLFHYTAIFYFALIIPRYVKTRSRVVLYTVLIAAVAPLLYDFLIRVGPLSARLRMEVYFESPSGHFHLSSLVFIALFIVMTLYMYKVSKGDATMRMVANYDFISWISLGLIVLFSNNFFRINRPMIIITMIYLFSYFDKNLNIPYKKKVLLEVSCVTAVCVLLELLTRTWFNAIQVNSLFSVLG